LPQVPRGCAVHGIDFRHRNITLTLQRWTELNAVNRAVNRDIIPQIIPGDGVTEEWVIAPRPGDCKDYAITKRHQLLALGWPSHALLLVEARQKSVFEWTFIALVRSSERRPRRR
jgi:predicted transglutaminase-like cysteine proteinase